MFDRFTERARQAVVCAQESARRLNRDSIGVEHIFLGLHENADSAAGRVLSAAGLSLERSTEFVGEVVAPRTGSVPGHLTFNPFTPAAKATLETALRKALALGDTKAGTDHLLLGVLASDDEVIRAVLGRYELGAETIERLVRDQMATEPPGEDSLGRAPETA